MQKLKSYRPVIRSSCLPPLWVIFLILLAIAQSAHGQAVKILPLGDSLTHGVGQHVAYRYDLWFKLIDAGFDVDFVGGNRNTWQAPDYELYPQYLSEFDRDHQGHAGWETARLSPIAAIAAAKYLPDIVLLWAGGADIRISGVAGVDSAKSGLHNIIAGIRQSVPGVTILLGLVTPAEIPNAAFIEPLNDTIANVASDLDTAESPIILIDNYTGYDVGTMTQEDGAHQNRVGEAWVAENWFEVLADILPDSEPEPFQINSGHAGAWYNPATSGQGGFIDIDPENSFMFLSWFTYTPGDADHPDEVHWFTAQGNYVGNTAGLDVYETTGGGFNGPQAVDTELVGTAIVKFDDCETGKMTYDLTAWDKQGEFPIQRAIPGTENVCEQLNASSTQTVNINAGMDGSWYNPETAGQGFFLDAQAPSGGDGFLFLSWFTFGEDTDSGLRWLTAQGGYSGPTAELEVYETTGGRFDDAKAVDTVNIGTATVTFDDCSNAQVAYNLPDEGKQGEIEVTRALPGSSGLCEEATNAR